jgi:hypothetical protein
MPTAASLALRGPHGVRAPRRLDRVTQGLGAADLAQFHALWSALPGYHACADCSHGDLTAIY